MTNPIVIEGEDLSGGEEPQDSYKNLRYEDAKIIIDHYIDSKFNEAKVLIDLVYD